MIVVTNVPENRTIRTGIMVKSGSTPIVAAISEIGNPCSNPNDMAEPVIPTNIAAIEPFIRLNSPILSCFFSSETCLSFNIPDQAERAIPKQATTIPHINNVPPEPFIMICNLPSIIGGIRVPIASINPSERAYPSDNPR